MSHGPRYAWRSSWLGHFTDTDATCVLDLESTCHTGGWCFGSLFDNWRVSYAPRIRLEGIPEQRGPHSDAGWLSAEPIDCDQCGNFIGPIEALGRHICDWGLS